MVPCLGHNPHSPASPVKKTTVDWILALLGIEVYRRCRLRKHTLQPERLLPAYTPRRAAQIAVPKAHDTS